MTIDGLKFRERGRLNDGRRTFEIEYPAFNSFYHFILEGDKLIFDFAWFDGESEEDLQDIDGEIIEFLEKESGFKFDIWSF